MGKLMAAPPMHHQSHRRHLKNLPLMALNLLQRTRLNPHLQRLPEAEAPAEAAPEAEAPAEGGGGGDDDPFKAA